MPAQGERPLLGQILEQPSQVLGLIVAEVFRRHSAKPCWPKDLASSFCNLLEWIQVRHLPLLQRALTSASLAFNGEHMSRQESACAQFLQATDSPLTRRSCPASMRSWQAEADESERKLTLIESIEAKLNLLFLIS